MRFSQRIRRWFVFQTVRLAIVIAKTVPLQMGVWFGSILGKLAFRCLRKEREKTLKHLRQSFGEEKSEEEILTIASSSFQNLGKSFFELLNLKKIKRKGIDKLVTAEGIENLEAGLDNGKGVIWLTGHIGNWELMAAYVSAKGYPLSVIASSVYDHRLNHLLLKFRSDHHTKTILRGDRSAGKQILRCLRNNEVLGILIDQDIDADGVFVDFFGRLAYTPKGAASLALRMGAVVVPGFIIRQENGKHRITILKPVELSVTGDNEKDVFQNTCKFTKIIEDYVRKYPDQWVWMHRRWKRQPPVKQ